MRATGIVRRIDDLGRVVIPKEIRRQMRIKEGEPLEIYTDPTEKIVGFKKYQKADPTTTIMDLLNDIEMYGNYTYEDIDEMKELGNEIIKILNKY